ncbi:ring finger domain-containing protein [Fusarium oxysporum f. sp. phaseoli]
MAIANVSHIPMTSPGCIKSEEWIQSLPIIIFFVFLFIFYALLITYEYAISHQQNNQIPIQGDSESDLPARSISSEISDLQRLDSTAPPQAYKQVATGMETTGSEEHSTCPYEVIICAICLEAIADSDIIRWLPCRHIFHSSCLTLWYLRRHYACPLCVSRYVTLEHEHVRENR